MAERGVAAWQNRMAPLMAGAVVLAAVFFCTISVLQFESLQDRLEDRPADLAPLLLQFDALSQADGVDRAEVLRTKALITLEQQALNRRYDQAAAIVVSKLWTRFMGFVTGMLLALIGAAFVLGRLRETASTLSATGQGLGVSLTSASPGLVLSTLGVALMGLAIASSFEITTTDVPVYFPERVGRAEPPARTDDLLGAAEPLPDASPPPPEDTQQAPSRETPS